jgi:GT2 family glycosyltransferase
MHPLVSIIVLNYNLKKISAKCIESLLKVSYPNFEIIVVDNASVDGSYEYLKKKFSNKITLVRSVKNLGYAGGNNLGYAHSKGEYVLILNNDTIVEPDFVTQLVRAIQEDKDIVACSCKIRAYPEKERLYSAGADMNFLGMTLLAGYGDIDDGSYDKRRQVFYPSGAGMLIRRDFIEKYGLFHPDYFIYGEDVALGWKINLLGKKIMYVPSSVIYHIGSLTVKKTSTFKLYLGQRNRFRNILTFYETRTLLKVLPPILLFYILRICLAFSKLEFRKVLALIKPIPALIEQFPDILKDRREISEIRIVSDRELLKKPITYESPIKSTRIFDSFLREYWRELVGP